MLHRSSASDWSLFLQSLSQYTVPRLCVFALLLYVCMYATRVCNRRWQHWNSKTNLTSTLAVEFHKTKSQNTLDRPVPIILFFLPIILFRISQNILLLFLRIDPMILNYSHKVSLQHKWGFYIVFQWTRLSLRERVFWRRENTLSGSLELVSSMTLSTAEL